MVGYRCVYNERGYSSACSKSKNSIFVIFNVIFYTCTLVVFRLVSWKQYCQLESVHNVVYINRVFIETINIPLDKRDQGMKCGIFLLIFWRGYTLKNEDRQFGDFSFYTVVFLYGHDLFNWFKKIGGVSYI